MNPIEQRELAFIESLRPYIDKYGREMLNDFYRYWTERNPGGRKMRFEMQKVFDVSRRLITWYKNNKKHEFTRKDPLSDESIAGAIHRGSKAIPGYSATQGEGG